MKYIDEIKKISEEKLPKHIAIIMDGNGRWAKKQNKERIFGHQQGVHAVRNAIEGAGEANIKFLTLYAFSTENWNRPQKEVNALLFLLVKTINAELDNLQKNRVKLNSIGDLNSLPSECQQSLLSAIEKTKNNKGLTLTLALSYSSRWEIVETIKKLATDMETHKIALQNIDYKLINTKLDTFPLPDPDILIRTGGEYRISNFLLLQLAYTELFFLPVMWPDFNKEDLWSVILAYLNRQRRFGKTEDQITK